MGRRTPEFEVERRREDRALVKDVGTSKNESKDGEASGEAAGGDGEENWTSWAENPRAVESMKYFVYAQSFVMFLTYGLPQLQKFWDMLQSLLFS